jgi:hypothetical protein
MAMIHEAITAIASEVPAVTKDRRNQQQGFQYRGIDDVYAAIHPLFTKHGVFSVPTVLEERSEERTTKNGSALIYRIVKVRYDFYAKDGSTIAATVMGEGMDSGDKASNKALAVAHKYALVQVLSIPTEETMDPDAESHEVKPAPRPAPRPAQEKDIRKDMIRDLLAELCPTDEEREALRQEMYHDHGADLDAVLKDLETRQINAAGRKAS